MFYNYLRSALRNLKSNKSFTAINIFGLALGLATCLLIVFYVQDELSYDRYNNQSTHIFRINEDLKLGNNRVRYAVCMAPLAHTLLTDYPYIKAAVRLKRTSYSVKKGNENLSEQAILLADPSVFSVFTLPFLVGDPSTALLLPRSVVITKSTALKYFDRIDVIGRSLVFNDSLPFKITGIIKDIPKQSHFKADMLVSMATYPDSRSSEWLRSDYHTYILLNDPDDKEKLEASFPAFLRKYAAGQMQKELGVSLDAFERGGSYFKLNLSALTAIHLHGDLSGEFETKGSMQYIYMLSSIALAVMLLACINFMNLSTARSANRAREVGMRKVMGSSRKLLVFQFLLESILVTAIAMLIALMLFFLALPAFNSLSGKQLSVTIEKAGWLIPISILSVIGIGLFAGSYPAFFLSAVKPIDMFKGKLAAGFKGGKLRSVLVVFQFTISIFLIIGTLVIYKQLTYIQARDIGYSRKQVLVIKNVYELGAHASTYRQQIGILPGVSSVTMTGFIPTSAIRNTSIFYKDATGNAGGSIFPQVWSVDEQYLKTMGMRLTAGRFFKPGMSSDSTALVINETAARFLGFKNPLAAILYKSASSSSPQLIPYHIIGIIKDFNFNSLRDNVSPLFMVLGKDTGIVSLKVNASTIPALLDALQVGWKRLSPAQFEYSFMDADFDASYQHEQQIGKIFIVFTVLAILIACLGLFGLAAYSSEQRTREISIRKVLGASIWSVVMMLSADFLRLVVLAIVIATPLAYLVMQQWLQGFAYRQNITLLTFVISGAGSLLIAFLTVSLQTMRAATANPIKGIKAE